MHGCEGMLKHSLAQSQLKREQSTALEQKSIMANCCAVISLYGLLMLLSWRGAAPAQDDEHYRPCPEGWAQHGASCFQYNDTAVSQQEAAETCHQLEAHLVIIDDDSENSFVEGFLNDVATALWLGAYYISGYYGWYFIIPGHNSQIQRIPYHRWTFSFYNDYRLERESCSKIEAGGSWNPEYCTASLPFLCEKPPPCEVGWFGEDCSSRCHCHESLPCKQEDGLCPRGCSPGWTGRTCNTENNMPEASFHCLRTIDNSLRADLTVDTKSREYRVVQAVSQAGEPLPCSLPKVRQKGNSFYVTVLLPGAFANSSSGVNGTDSSSGVNGTDGDMGTADGAGGVQTTSRTPVDATSGSAGAVKETSSTPAETTGTSVTNYSVTDSSDENVNVTTAESEGDGSNLTAKRDVSAKPVGGDTGGDCVASRSGNGTVTWLIEFKQFESITTGSDITVEVTCEIDEADNLEPLDSVYDDSDKEDPLMAAKTSVMTSVYLVDAFSSERQDRFHLGQTLQLHIDVEGLMDNECAFPHSCVVRPKDAQGKGFTVLDKNGCPVRGSPISALLPDGSGHFTSNDFPAFSLGSSLVLLECQVDVVYSGYHQDCSQTCRSSPA